MNIFVLYERPEDYPEHFVVREQTIKHGKFISYGMPKLAATLEEARKAIPKGLTRQPRAVDDVPAIVEWWI